MSAAEGRQGEQTLPFLCPFCATRFGFGDGARLLAVVNVLPFTDSPTPCCGVELTGSYRRERDGSIQMHLTSPVAQVLG